MNKRSIIQQKSKGTFERNAEIKGAYHKYVALYGKRGALSKLGRDYHISRQRIFQIIGG